MTAYFAANLLGWKASSKNAMGWSLVPNSADADNAPSLRIAAGMLDNLGIARGVPSAVPTKPGVPLEQYVTSHLVEALPELDERRSWEVIRGRIITDFAQYEHLQTVDRLVQANPELRVTLGRDYLIKPDVTVGIISPDLVGRTPFLHAAISCKWTIRSDRVQNIRHEFLQMIRHRRGRQPHLVTVTAEPLPTRLASIARGTGEVDAVYHIALEALAKAVADHGSLEQVEAWDEVIAQRRLLSYQALDDTLVRW